MRIDLSPLRRASSAVSAVPAPRAHAAAPREHELMQSSAWWRSFSFVFVIGGLMAIGVASANVNAEPSLYVGALIDQADGAADFAAIDNQHIDACYDEGGMHFEGAHLPCDPGGFWGYVDPCGNGTATLYFDGGAPDMMSISRLDGIDFDSLELCPGSGNPACDTYLWIRAYLDDEVVGDWALDNPAGRIVGVRGGGFDELRIGAYRDAATRDINRNSGDETRGQNLIDLDNVQFGSIEDISLISNGACPGEMEFAAFGATPGNGVAFVYAFGTGSVTIPNGRPCAGTPLALNATAQVLTVIDADAVGAASLRFNVPAAACGRVFVQALDIASCMTSNNVGL